MIFTRVGIARERGPKQGAVDVAADHCTVDALELASRIAALCLLDWWEAVRAHFAGVVLVADDNLVLLAQALAHSATAIVKMADAAVAAMKTKCAGCEKKMQTKMSYISSESKRREYIPESSHDFWNLNPARAKRNEKSVITNNKPSAYPICSAPKVRAAAADRAYVRFSLIVVVRDARCSSLEP